jgi:hypothetical protein
MRRGVAIRRWHQPLLHATRLGFRALRAEPRLRRRGLRTDDSEHNQNGKRFAQWHEFPWHLPVRRTPIAGAEYLRRIKSSAFFRERGRPKTIAPYRFAQPGVI